LTRFGRFSTRSPFLGEPMLRRLVEGWQHPRFRIRLTRIGGFYLLISLMTAAAATNTGNNGLFIASSLLLGTLAISGVVSRRNLWRLGATVDFPEEVFASGETSVALLVRSRSVQGVSRVVRVEYGKSFGELDAKPNGSKGMPPRKGNDPAAISISRPGTGWLIGSLRGIEPARVPVCRTFLKRGREHPGVVELVSEFPFGFFRKSRLIELTGDVIVYPRIIPIDDRLIQAASRGTGEGTSRQAGRSPEFDWLRDFHSGDDPRDIHWKQSAKHRRLILKQRLAEGSGWTTILFDPGEVSPEKFEALVSSCASLAVALIDRGRSVSLRTRKTRIPPSTGRDQRKRILDSLALVGPETETAPPRLEPPAAGEIRIRAEEISG